MFTSVLDEQSRNCRPISTHFWQQCILCSPNSGGNSLELINRWIDSEVFNLSHCFLLVPICSQLKQQKMCHCFEWVPINPSNVLFAFRRICVFYCSFLSWYRTGFLWWFSDVLEAFLSVHVKSRKDPRNQSLLGCQSDTDCRSKTNSVQVNSTYQTGGMYSFSLMHILRDITYRCCAV